ncbi:MAG: gentisate 1,2-dioxygenase [Acidobacteria bacterium]|nr:MAG: gentisate 1,2-dioxygenase [Acidobacteriota bacterium]
METSGFRFVDQTGAAAPAHRPAEPVVIPREAIEAEVERLASLPRPANGRRLSRIANPASGPGDALAPGIAVSVCVLLPGERTRPIRHNSAQVDFCIRGRGTAVVAGRRIAYEQYDVWNTPPWAVYEHVNDSGEPHVRLTYSNSALLEKMNVHVVEEDPPAGAADAEDAASAAEAGRTAAARAADATGATDAPDAHEGEAARRSPFGTFPIGEDGAYLMPYETLISPDVVGVPALHWPWRRVKAELDKLGALGTSYVGRRLYLLYHPATGRTNGTTQNFFATITIRPADIADRPHRHTAAAINYFFAGRGDSIVEGKRYAWKAGDLMLTAPGWAVHRHASHDEPVYELTIQDSPLNIAMGSLLWQEDLGRPPEALGLTGGFATNRADVGSRR